VGETTYRYLGRPVPVRFLARPNRYLAIVRRESGGPRFEAHVPNPGRMEELLLPGLTKGFAMPMSSTGRRTRFDLVSVWHGSELVSIDSRVANRLVGRALATGALRWARPGDWRSEQRWGQHRFDFAKFLPNSDRPSDLLEVKSSNLKVGDTAWFPDAPTDRGRRHLEALAKAIRTGTRCEVLFAIQRSDVQRFRPNRALDPGFGRAFDLARRAGVGFHAIRMRVRSDRVSLGPPVPVL
jgi:sugar fermentation stimulation protein A